MLHRLVGSTLAHEMQSTKMNPQKGGIDMKSSSSKLGAIFLMAVWVTLMATPVFAKSFSMKDAGISLWIFIIIGAFIILLQLIPAAILFFSFIGTGTAMAFRRKKAAEGEREKEEMALSSYGPVKNEK